MLMLGVLWVLIGVSLLDAGVPARAELIDLPDWLRAALWVAAGVVAIATAGHVRASVWGLAGLALAASERAGAWLVAWFDHDGNAPATKLGLYLVALWAVWITACIPADREVR
ncbi:hypothetical protein ACTND8_07115 [Atopobiaceae bacterium HCP3S3_F7]